MSLERKDAINLARALAARLGAEPEKWGKAIEKASRAPSANPCASSYGPLPHGSAAKSLNLMHQAANGTNPINRKDDYSPDSCTEFGDNCIEGGGYNPSECTSLNGFGGDVYCTNPGGGFSGYCISPDIYMCSPEHMFTCHPPFKCNSPFNCAAGFGGCNESSKYCQCADGECMNNQANFNCSNFVCSAKGASEFGCHVPGGDFRCRTTNSVFGCCVAFTCNEEPYNCEAGMHNCDGRFECQTDDYYNCANYFICHNDSVKCYDTFTCHSEFVCIPLQGFANTDCEDENYDCLTVFNCGLEAYHH
jgi:hypothetical protein